MATFEIEELVEELEDLERDAKETDEDIERATEEAAESVSRAERVERRLG